MPKISVAAGATNADDPDAQPERATRTYSHDVASVDALAERAYCAYAAAVDWKAYDGSDLPDWGDIDDEAGSNVTEGWRAVARDLRGALLEPGGARAVATRPEPVEVEPAEVGTDEPPVDESGAEYPEGGSAADVESWVAGDSDRAAYALEREHDRTGGPRAGLSAALGKLTNRGFGLQGQA